MPVVHIHFAMPWQSFLQTRSLTSAMLHLAKTSFTFKEVHGLNCQCAKSLEILHMNKPLQSMEHSIANSYRLPWSVRSTEKITKVSLTHLWIWMKSKLTESTPIISCSLLPSLQIPITDIPASKRELISSLAIVLHGQSRLGSLFNTPTSLQFPSLMQLFKRRKQNFSNIPFPTNYSSGIWIWDWRNSLIHFRFTFLSSMKMTRVVLYLASQI